MSASIQNLILLSTNRTAVIIWKHKWWVFQIQLLLLFRYGPNRKLELAKHTSTERLDRFAFLYTHTCFLLTEWALSLSTNQTVTSPCTFPSHQLTNQKLYDYNFSCLYCPFVYISSVKVLFNYEHPFHCLNFGKFWSYFDFQNSTICLVSLILDGSILLMCP